MTDILNTIEDAIAEATVDQEGRITRHGNWCLGLLAQVRRGERPVIEDSGLELFGLEEFCDFEGEDTHACI